MDKKLSGVSQTMSRFRGWIQAGATLLTNLHLPNFLKGGLYQGAGKTVCVPGLNCYSCPAASGACPTDTSCTCLRIETLLSHAEIDDDLQKMIA